MEIMREGLILHKCFDIAEYGAVPFGRELNTESIQRAIDECHDAGGGRVFCGAGMFLTGAIELKSNVELHLDRGCRIVGSPRLEDYQPLIADGFNHERAPEKSSESLIRAVGAENIAITGHGEINGSGPAFYEDAEKPGKLEKPGTPRPRLGMFYHCRDIRVEDVKLVDSACWTLWLMMCENAHISRVSITGDRRLRNIDGIDLDACRNVTMSDCLIDTEDDCIVLRAIQNLYEESAVCENISVANCVLKSSCQAVRVGCPGDGVIRNAVLSNLVIESTQNGIVFQNPHRYLPAGNPGSAHVSNIMFSNIVMKCAGWPIQIQVEEGIALPSLGDLSFSDFWISGGKPCLIQGSAETTIRNVKFSNMRIETSGDDAIICRRCEGLHLENVELSNMAGNS